MLVSKLAVALLAGLIRVFCREQHVRLDRSANQPDKAQNRLLKKLVKDLALTQYGKHHGITGSEDYRDFAQKMPICNYADLAPWIDRQLDEHSYAFNRNGGSSSRNRKTNSVITPHRIVHVEPTSGSIGAVKRIPVTGRLLRSFTNMFSIWAYDQLKNGLKPETGRIFVSVSPRGTVSGSTDGTMPNPVSSTATVSIPGPGTSPGADPNSLSRLESKGTSERGFSGDDQYLTEPLRSILSRYVVKPSFSSVSSSVLTSGSASFHESLALTLLLESDLEVISIWSPSYLLVLLDFIERNRKPLARALPEARRQILLAESIDWKNVWPRLKLISLWDNALAEPLSLRVKELFPDVQIQGKGLLATEAPITVPLIEAGGCIPLLDEVFLEFEGKDGTIRLLHELEDGKQYEIIVTQAAGLTRYRLNDLVCVSGFYKKTALLKFVGRSNLVCDMAGEKLHEGFVREALTRLIPSGNFIVVPYQRHLNVTHEFTQIRSVGSADSSTSAFEMGYILVIDQNVIAANAPSTFNISSLEEARDFLCANAERALQAAHHYHQARGLEQIAHLEMIVCPELRMNLLSFHQSEGMKMGDIKDVSLLSDTDKAQRLLDFIQRQAIYARAASASVIAAK